MLTRSTSPWTEIEDRVETLPWEKRNFPLSEEELKDLEVNIYFKSKKERWMGKLTLVFVRLRRGRCRATD